MTDPLELDVNGTVHAITVAPETPLLWVLRDVLGLRGTKFGCGGGHCGACTVLVGGTAVRSCVMPVGRVSEAVQTIEGVDHPITAAWTEVQVPQCGYCQSGQIMAALGLLAETPSPTDEDIDRGMQNLCRCGTYNRIRRAIHHTADELGRPEPKADELGRPEPKADEP